MTITATVIADSKGRGGAPRITTFLLRYPRFFHAEFLTHRLFSRNASSSRAIPVKRMIADLLNDTALPIHWGKNQPGMQAFEENDQLVLCPFTDEYMAPEDAWNTARDAAIMMATAFDQAGYHKQVVNRLLEPFTHINVLVTATDFSNFYWLRNHEDAQPEIKVLAEAMIKAQNESTPQLLDEGQWHMPFITDRERNFVWQTMGRDNDVIEEPITQDELLKISVARSARTSYLTHEGKVPTVEADLSLYERLVGTAPLHASPAEHQAMVDEKIINDLGQPEFANPHLSGNFDPGFVQYRKTLKGERCCFYELEAA